MTHLPIRNKAELETGSHFQLPTERQTRQRCLCFHSVYRLYLRPNTVPSRWDTVGAPGDFSPGRLTQPRGQAALPLHTIPRLTRRGGCGRLRRGRAWNARAHFPLPTSRLKYTPPQRTAFQLQEGAHSTPRQRSRSPPQGVLAKALRCRAQDSSSDAESHALDTPPGQRSNPRTLGDSTMHWPKGHCLQPAHPISFWVERKSERKIAF